MSAGSAGGGGGGGGGGGWKNADGDDDGGERVAAVVDGGGDARQGAAGAAATAVDAAERVDCAAGDAVVGGRRGVVGGVVGVGRRERGRVAVRRGIDAAALAAIARLADGGMRDSQSILDQMIAFCGDAITEADVLEVYGLVSAEKVGELARAIARAKGE